MYTSLNEQPLNIRPQPIHVRAMRVTNLKPVQLSDGSYISDHDLGLLIKSRAREVDRVQFDLISPSQTYIGINAMISHEMAKVTQL